LGSGLHKYRTGREQTLAGVSYGPIQLWRILQQVSQNRCLLWSSCMLGSQYCEYSRAP
jgi:hypothetical protein